MDNSFKNRVFGCAIIKSINSNYNADFMHQPRTLPDGTVYATDKVLKYSIRNYFKQQWPSEKVFYFKSLNEDMQPRDLDQAYISNFGEYPKTGKKEDVNARKIILENLLKCIDVRLFGGTFASKVANLSLHGCVQFTPGVNRFPENNIYSEQISSPFRNSTKEKNVKENEEAVKVMQTTLGTQFKLKEGHYVHHISVNPGNLEGMASLVGNGMITKNDIDKLKEGLRNGVTFYDSAAKIGTENELLLWVELREGSNLVLPSFVELVEVNEAREIDLKGVCILLGKENVKKEISKIEVYYNKGISKVINIPEGAVEIDLN